MSYKYKIEVWSADRASDAGILTGGASHIYMVFRNRQSFLAALLGFKWKFMGAFKSKEQAFDFLRQLEKPLEGPFYYQAEDFR